MKRVILSALFVAALAAPAWAGFAEGRAAYDAGDYTTALLEWLPLARAGNPAAQYGVGTMYESGQGVAQDYAEAMRLYRLAAAQNYATASLNIGVMYFQGRGVAQDHAEAARWFREAADQGSAMAAFNLGVMRQTGEGLPRDMDAAVGRFRQAAAMGLPRAMSRLATMYRDGRDVPPDLVQAYAWFSLAEQRTRLEEPKRQLAALRDDVGGRLGPQRLAQAQELARLWASNPAAMVKTAAAPGAPVSPRELATQVQQLLAALGYDPGPADGMPGARTREAIRKFETDRGLPVVGAVSPELLLALRQAHSATQ